MSPRLFIAVLSFALAVGCGGSTPEPTEQPEPAAESFEMELTSAELTTSVDEENRTAAAPVADEFPVETRAIYLVAVITGLPPDTALEVSWSSLKGGDPLYVSRATASGDYTMLARLRPPGAQFQPGAYQAFVYANNHKLGSVRFRIGDPEQRWTGVRELTTSAAVEAWTHKPIEPKSSFYKGVRKVFATFLVGTDDPNPYVRLSWFRGEQVLFENDLECGNEKRCVDVYELKKPIPTGDYAVEVDVNGDMLSRRSFHVGGDSVSPVLDHAALGVAKGKKKLPKRPQSVFTPKLSGLRCGVRFLNLPDETRVTVQWFAVKAGGDEQLHKSEAKIEGGGTKIEVLDWEIDGALDPGRYKAVILLGERKLTELAFTVE
jgi:hypothetical protein